MALSTVSAVLTRIGLGKLSRLEPPEPPNRYERRPAGELMHVDVKKLGRDQRGAGHRVTGTPRSQNANRRGAPARAPKGWEFVHVCVDDATRLAYVEVLADEQGDDAPPAFLRRAVAFYAAYGITVQRVMSDNGACYRSTLTPSPAARSACATCAPAPTGRAPTAKPSASSAPCSPAGPTAPSTAPAPNAPPPLTAGSGPTTIAAHTAPSATSRPQPAYAS